MSKPYTKEQFDEYVSAVKHWLNQLNITGWTIDFKQRHIGESIAGNTTYNTVSRNACFQLAEFQTGDYCLHDDMNALALHEVLHLLVADLVWTVKELKDDMHDLVIAKEHELINRLIPALRDKGSLQIYPAAALEKEE